MQTEILDQAHTFEFGGGHTGQDRTYDKLRVRFYWPNMYRDTIEFVQSCGYCRSRLMRRPRMPMHNMPVPTYPFEMIAIDTSGPFPESESGNRYAISIIDHFSSWPEVYPARDKSAETVAKIILEKIIPRHSCPRVILSDNGTEYVNAINELLFKRLKISHIRCSVYHPAGNGKIERFHRFMNDVISKYAYQDQTKWESYIPAVLMAYRTSLHDSTGYTPFFLMRGCDPVLPMDTLLNPKFKYLGDDYVPCMLQRLHHAYSMAQRNLVDARERNKERLNVKTSLPQFKVGDPVFYFDKVVRPGETAKFSLLWKPHYRIVEQTSPVNFRIKDQMTGKHKLVHAENIKLAHPEQIWDAPRETPEHVDRDFEDLERRAPTRVQPMRQAKTTGLLFFRPIDKDPEPPRKRKRVSKIDTPSAPVESEPPSAPVDSEPPSAPVESEMIDTTPSSAPVSEPIQDDLHRTMSTETLADAPEHDSDMDCDSRQDKRKCDEIDQDDESEEISKRLRIARVRVEANPYKQLLKKPVDILRSYMKF